MERHNTSYGECRCCLVKGYHKDIMKEYYINGAREVYTDIFMECFNLFLSTNKQLSTLICISCIKRLKDANSFRLMAVSSEEHLMKSITNKETVFVNDCCRIKMPRKSKISKPGVRKYGMKSNYSKGALERALNEIKSGALTRIQASKKYKIPPVTLYYKVNEKHSKSIGRPLALTESEEESFKTHLSLLCDLGIPINMRDFRVIAKKYLDSENKKIKQFHNNMPGYEWGTLFLERHPDLKVKIANNIHRKRAHVSCKQIEAFFTNLEKDIEGIPPENIFNMTESGFHDDPSKKNLLFRRDSRHPELIKNATKSCYTVTFCVNAAGDTLPPFFIFKGKKLRSDWLALAPQDSRMAVSDSGWITTEVFEEWLEMHFIPSVRKLEGKKMLFCDYLSAHISPKVLRLCEEYNIVFTCLTPKSNLVQPFDVGYLFSVKSNWRKVLNNYRRTCRGKKQMALPKCLFAQLMRKTLEIGEASRVDNIKAGFRSSGLYPFSPKTVLNKLPNYTLESYERESVDKVFDRCIGEVRSPDLSSATKRKKLQSPITVGKNVSAEEITKYYEENAKSQDKGTKSSSMKRGRPAGSKNRKKKKAIPTEDEDDRIPINSDLLQDEDAYIVVVEADAQGIESPSQILRDAISYTIESKGNESQDQETEDDDIDLDLSEDNLYSEG